MGTGEFSAGGNLGMVRGLVSRGNLVLSKIRRIRSDEGLTLETSASESLFFNSHYQPS